MSVAVSTFAVTNFWASAWRAATRFSTRSRRVVASFERSDTTVVACERIAFGSNSKPLTDFWTPSNALTASFWTPSMRFCASAT